VELALLTRGSLETASASQPFELKPLPGFSLGEPDFQAVAEFQETTADLLRRARGMAEEVERAEERLRHIKAALLETPRAEPRLFSRVGEINAALADLRVRLVGDRLRDRWNEASVPSVLRRVRQVAGGHWDTRQSPTETQRRSLEIAQQGFVELAAELQSLLEKDLPAFEADLEAAGAPWTPGRKLPQP
jgi:hypothetical protein